MSKILIVKASARKESTGTKVVQWVENAIKVQHADAEIDIVDLATFHLPFDAEPNMPATGKYVTDATKLWSEKVTKADVIVFVTPEYNGSYTAALKNAIDHLKNEWKTKKALVVAYSPSGANSVVEILGILLKRLEVQVLANVKVATYSLGFDGDTGVAKEFEKVVDSEAQQALQEAVKAI